MTVTRTAPTPAFDALRTAAAASGGLAALEPHAYATGHALFEARSDQRERVTRWLEAHLPAGPAPTRVLSIGTGDGSVDLRVAARLAAGGAQVDYLGVEPHAPSGAAFLQRLQALSGVVAALAPVPFSSFVDDGKGYDVVLAVHSLYYVADLRVALAAARSLVAPGGELIVLHAPREALNVLVGLLAPGIPQEFSDAVGAALSGVAHTRERIEATLDLRPGEDRDGFERALDFAVQAAIPDPLRPLVIDALREASPDGDLLLAHAIDAFVVPQAA